MMQQTSLMAYFTLRGVNRKQREVYNALQEMGAACNLDIAEHLNRPINTITPRMGELVAKGLVREAYRARCKTGRQAIYWEVI